MEVVRYDAFIAYLTKEIGGGGSLADGALIECLVKHRELVSGPRVWSPRARAYLQFDAQIHGAFASLKPRGPTSVRFLGKLLPVYCRLCFLRDRHGEAHAEARALLARLKDASGIDATAASASLRFEIRALEYLIENLSSAPPPEWGYACQSSDVSAEAKIAVELLWSHLVLVYAGNRRLLLCNVELFFSRPERSTALCPSELRAALFTHGKHEPFAPRRARVRGIGLGSPAGRDCPVLPPPSRGSSRGRSPRGSAAQTERLCESRVSRLCWLGALWLLGREREGALHWLHKPEPHRA